jgi:replicative DNA helicase
LLLLDYIQRIPPPGEHGDRWGAVNATMNYLRQFADAGTAVLVVSAIGRTKDGKGRSSYAGEGLNLASFRESSELEFGCDDAFILVPDGEGAGTATLRHLKSRHGEAKDLELSFDGKLQRFTPFAGTARGRESGNRKNATLAAMWQRAAAAKDGDESEADA